MASSCPHDRNPLTTKLESIVRLSDDERTALDNLPMQITDLKADQDIVREGDRPSRCCALLEGFTCTYKVTAAGKRQITSFHVPGDIPDLQSLHLETMDISLGTITPCKVGFVQHEALRELCWRHPRMADALWRETLIYGAIYREWMTGIGRRDAYSRIAHFLCETVVRLRVVRLAQEDTCNLPITQSELGDALGLTTVHVNRTLQDLRGAGLIVLKDAVLQVLDWKRLKEAGEFDPTYLHLKHLEAA